MKTFNTIFLFFILSNAIAQKMNFSGQTDEFFLDFTSAKTEVNALLPEINWINPQAKSTIYKSRKYKLHVNIKSINVLEKVDVFLNDYPLIKQRGLEVVSIKAINDYEQIVDTEVLLRSGENTIRITATNIDGGTVTSIRKINVVADEQKNDALNRKDYAILFATDEYDYWDNLLNPVNDVSTISTDLKSIYGFEVEVVKNPTKREILQKLREYTKKSFMPNDQLFIMFAGHGHFDQLFNQGYLVCADSKITDEERLSYISHNNLRGIIDNIPNKHIFLTIDACFGGTFDPFIRSSAHRGYGPNSDELEQYEYINRKLKQKTRKFLTSGGKEYVSDGKPGQHSPFTRKMLEAIRSYGGDDNVLTLSEIKSFVEKIDPEPRFGEFGTNEPGSDFIFVVK